jgi:hypothetical protein
MILPDDLTELDQWVLWKRENGTKVPYRLDGRKASTTRPEDWSEYSAVLGELERHPKTYAGTGFVFSASDDLAGIDLDDCLEDTTGNPKPWCQGLLERFADTYTEISPSGLGIKIWCRGKLPANVGDTPTEDGAISLWDHSKYFAVTGQAFREAPLEIEDHQSDLDALFAALVDSGASGRYQVKYQIPATGKIAHGVQHWTLVSICGALRRRGVCDQAIEACLQEVNRRQCELPGPPQNIVSIVRSSRRWRRP